MNRKRRTTVSILFVAAYLFFILLADYPFIARMINDAKQGNIVLDYRKDMLSREPTEVEKAMASARDYNNRLRLSYSALRENIEGGTKGMPLSDRYWRELKTSGQDIMCTVRIPAIGVSLPVYHGTGDEVLQLGAGHLKGTSLPVGGKSTHCCISAHRGLVDKTMFTDIDLLKKGDRIYMDVLDTTLEYRVTGKQTVLPDNVKALQLQEGKDLLTLVTCTPYGINTHRLYVHAKRYVPYLVVEDTGESLKGLPWLAENWWRIATVALLCAMFATLRIYLDATAETKKTWKRKLPSVIPEALLVTAVALALFENPLRERIVSMVRGEEETEETEFEEILPSETESEVPLEYYIDASGRVYTKGGRAEAGTEAETGNAAGIPGRVSAETETENPDAEETGTPAPETSPPDREDEGRDSDEKNRP